MISGGMQGEILLRGKKGQKKPGGGLSFGVFRKKKVGGAGGGKGGK